jgi:hypothetical protein
MCSLPILVYLIPYAISRLPAGNLPQKSGNHGGIASCCYPDNCNISKHFPKQFSKYMITIAYIEGFNGIVNISLL